MINEVKITRRSAVGKLGTLLAAGLWPGVLKANSSNRKYVPIRFSVLNDFHHENEQCDHWFTELFRSAGGHGGVSFIVGLGDLANKGKKESISAIKRISIEGKVPFYTVPGNHDNDLEGTTNVYSSILPDRLNYFWIVNDFDQYINCGAVSKYFLDRSSCFLMQKFRVSVKLLQRKAHKFFIHFRYSSRST